jgi:hypothetical protein
LSAIGSVSFAAHVNVTGIPYGYGVQSIELGVAFAGSIAQNPLNDNQVFVSVGGFGTNSVVRVDTQLGTTTTVTGVLGVVAGMTILSNGDLVITETFTSNTILRARDLTADGDFLDAGEITELIAPILTVDFTGAQAAVAPAGNVSGIPAGSLLVQTSDGATDSELLVIENPTTTPAYRPPGAAYYSGYQYNGGFAFDQAGNIIFGISQFSMITFLSSGKIAALVNSNSDPDIDPGESNVLVDETTLNAGLTDLTVSNEGTAYYTENSGAVKGFQLPANLLTGSGSPSTFLQTDSAYLSIARIDFPGRPFVPTTSSPRARMYVAGLDASFGSATNLLIVSPVVPTAAAGWEMYE